MKDPNISTNYFQRFKSLFIILDWLPKYKLKFLSFDLIAGITLASFVLPESMAYATLAGVPAEYGIYSIIAGGLLFSLFTSTKRIVVGPTSAISLMVGTSIAVLSEGDLQRWAAIASLTALAVFVLCIISYFLHLSSLVSFISENVLLGFKAGAALTIISTQLPELFGPHISGNNFFERLIDLFQSLGETNVAVLLFGGLAFTLLILGGIFFHGRPVSLIIVVISILIMSFTDLAKNGFLLLGDLPKGMPSLGRLSLRYTDIDGIFGLALACFLMGYIETVAVVKTFAEKYNETANPRQELLSVGFANLGAAFTSGFPVAGGLSQSTVNDKAGAKTPLTLIICSLVLIMIMSYFTGLLKNLPKVVLAAVVLNAVLGLIRIKALKRLYFLSRSEFSVAMVAVVGVLFFGILKGVLIATLISIIIILMKTKLPHVAVLGKIPDTRRYSDIQRNPDNEEIKYIKILRIESPILYFNEEYIHELLTQNTISGSGDLQMVIIDLSASPDVDVSGAEMLLKFANELKAKSIQLKIVEALATVRDMLRKLEVPNVTGNISRKDSIDREVEEFLKDKREQMD